MSNLPELIREMLRDEWQMVGTETVQVHPVRSFVIDVETARNRRRDFVQAVARIPNIEGGLSWQLLKPYVGGNGEIAKALIAIGAHLGIWQVMPDPVSCSDLYQTRDTLLPQSGVISSWPTWSLVKTGGDGAPRIDGGADWGLSVGGLVRSPNASGEEPPAYEGGEGGEYDPEELAGFLSQFK